jgi:hypothetical protein
VYKDNIFKIGCLIKSFKGQFIPQNKFWGFLARKLGKIEELVSAVNNLILVTEKQESEIKKLREKETTRIWS